MQHDKYTQTTGYKRIQTHVPQERRRGRREEGEVTEQGRDTIRPTAIMGCVGHKEPERKGGTEGQGRELLQQKGMGRQKPVNECNEERE
jgi:hypothetical protein